MIASWMTFYLRFSGGFQMGVTYRCLNCEKTDLDAPILSVRFKDQDVRICTSCLPVLIHQPQKLAGQLAGIETVEPANHTHD
jgi:hypothetical protein